MADKGASKTQNQSQNSATDPWAPTTGLLGNVIGDLGQQSVGLTPQQQAALTSLQSSTAGLPNFGNEGTDLVNRLFGTSTAPQVGMLTGSLDDLTKRLGSAADPNAINPFSNPGMTGVLDTLTKDITNRVKGTYAASGRDPSGAGSFAGSLARGLTEGEAPVVANQYNLDRSNQQGAAKTLYDAGQSTAGAVTTQNQVPLANATQGFNLASLIPSLLSGPAAAQVGAANAGFSQPFQNISSLLNPTAALASLGGTQSGTGTSTTTQSNSMLSNILGGAAGITGILGATGAFPTAAAGAGGAGWLASALPALMAFSDERVKEDIEPVGKTFDGQNLYSYRYLGDHVPRIGLLAQEVEERDPGAVVEIGGIKAVNYDRATLASRVIGMLDGERMAA